MIRFSLACLLSFGACAQPSPQPSPQPANHPSSPAASDPPNVLIILADDLGTMDIGAYNPDCFYETPNLDRLTRSSVRFTDGYAACPVCSPSRYSMLTGRYPVRAQTTNFFSGKRSGRFRAAVSEDRMPLEEETLAEALRGAGYATFFAGKWHLGPTAEYWPEAHGFDVNRGGFSRGGPYGGKKYFSPYGNPRLEDGPDGEHLPDRLATECAQFIEAKRARPWLAYLSFYSVHTPLMAPKELVAKYRARAAKITGAEFAEEEQTLPNNRKRRVRILQKHAVYAAMVESMDRAIGKVLDKLDELDLTEDTLIVFTSDNGGLSTSEGLPTSNLPFRGGKGWLYEGGIREPFVVRWPARVRGGRDCATPVCGIDVFPTVLDACKLEPRAEIDGRSLLPVLTSGDPETAAAESGLERPLFWHYPHYGNQGGFPGGAMRLGDWKFVQRYEDGRAHLYDLRNDPGERADRAADEPDRLARMRTQFHSWLRSTNARLLRPKKDGPMPWRPK